MEVTVKDAYERKLCKKKRISLSYDNKHIYNIGKHIHPVPFKDVVYLLHFRDGITSIFDKDVKTFYGPQVLDMFIDPLPLGRSYMRLKGKYIELYEACRTLDNVADRHSVGMWSYDEAHEYRVIEADWNNFLATVEDSDMFIAEHLKRRKK